MPIFLSSLFSLLSGIPGMIGQYFQQKAQIEQATIQANLLIQQATIQQATELAKDDAARAQMALGSTGQKFKYIVFWMISLPFLACLFGFKSFAVVIFDNLNSLPQGYLILYYSLIAVIWGIPVPGNAVSFVWQGIQNAVSNARQHTLNKMDKKIIYEAIRNGQGGQLPQSVVDKLDPILNKLTSNSDNN